MRLLSLSLLLAFFISSGWETDIEAAKHKAQDEHKFILLNFSGSDWCAPCIRMHKEIFENDAFKNYADGNLVLVNADFPRMKKNQLPKDQQKKNDALADKYNSKGIFPLTLLLAADGTVIQSWDGMPNETAPQFTKQVKDLVDSHK